MPENNGILKFVVNKDLLREKAFRDAVNSLVDKYMAETKDDQDIIRMLWAYFFGSFASKCMECSSEKNSQDRPYAIVNCLEDTCTCKPHGPAVMPSTARPLLMALMMASLFSLALTRATPSPP